MPASIRSDDRAHEPGPRRARTGRIVAASLLAMAVVTAATVATINHRQGRTELAANPSPAAAPTLSRAERLAGLEAAAQAKPQDPASWQNLAQALLGELARSGDPDVATRTANVIERATELAPTAPATLLGRATLAATLHRFDEALSLADRMLADNPLHPGALAVAVDALVELGNYDQAEERLQRLADRQPGVAALTRISYLREVHGDLGGALIAMTQAEVAANGSLGASSPEAGATVAAVVSLQGDVLWAAGRTAEAAARYAKALDLDPGLPLAEIGLARTAAASGDVAGAISRLERLVQRHPLSSATTQLADLQELAGRPADAASTRDLVGVTFKLAQSAGAVIDLELAGYEVDHGIDPQRALLAAEAAYRARPTTAAADVAASAWLRAGQPAKATQMITDALRLGTRDGGVHAHAAQIADANGDQAEARRQLAQAFDTNPWFTFSPSKRAGLSALAERVGISPPGAWA